MIFDKFLPECKFSLLKGMYATGMNRACEGGEDGETVQVKIMYKICGNYGSGTYMKSEGDTAGERKISKSSRLHSLMTETVT